MLADLKMRACEWQGKRNRLKRAMIVAALVVLAVLVSVGWNLLHSLPMRWGIAACIGGAALLTFFVTLSAYANTMLVSMYYTAFYRLETAPDELELVTGMVEDVQRVEMPYIGTMCHLTLQVAGETVRFYCSGRLLHGVQPHERIRLLAHDLFAVRVTTMNVVDTEVVEAGGKSTQTA